jgi:uncharacterized membrane protein YfcA
MLVGVVLALTGAGRGILTVPLLVFVVGLDLLRAAPIGLLAGNRSINHIFKRAEDAGLRYSPTTPTTLSAK